MILSRATIATPVGDMLALASGEGLCALEFTGPRKRLTRLEARLMVVGGLIWASMCGWQSAQPSDHMKANDALEDALRLTGWDAELS